MVGDAARQQRTCGRYEFGGDRKLSRRVEFEHLLRQGLRRSFGGYTFYFARRSDALPPRLGLLVSRKHARRATERNRIKRRIREAFRLEQGTLRGLDILVRPPFGIQANSTMMPHLRELLSRLNR